MGKKQPKQPTPKPTRTQRPFTPPVYEAPDPDAMFPPSSTKRKLIKPAICGRGPSTQIDIHRVLLDVPTKSNDMYTKDLALISRKVNKVFRAGGPRVLRRLRRKWDDESLELTLALHEGGLYLTYAKPVRTEGTEQK